MKKKSRSYLKKTNKNNTNYPKIYKCFCIWVLYSYVLQTYCKCHQLIKWLYLYKVEHLTTLTCFLLLLVRGIKDVNNSNRKISDIIQVSTRRKQHITFSVREKHHNTNIIFQTNWTRCLLFNFIRPVLLSHNSSNISQVRL